MRTILITNLTIAYASIMTNMPTMDHVMPFFALSILSCWPKDVAYWSPLDTKKYTAMTPVMPRRPLTRSARMNVTAVAP